MNRKTILNIAKEATAELGYRGWNVASVWQQKSLALPASGADQAQEAKTWFIDYTNDEGTLPRVYFKCRDGAGEQWVKEEIKRQLRSLRERLITTDAASAEMTDQPHLETLVTPLPPPAPPPAPAPSVEIIPETLAPVAPIKGMPAANGKEAALLRAASEGDPATVASLLVAGAHIDTRLENGMTPLIRAAFFGHSEVVRTLMEKGADLEARDRLGMSALDWALSRDHDEVVHLLDKAAGTPPIISVETEVSDEAPAEPAVVEEPLAAPPRRTLDELDLARPIASPPPAQNDEKERAEIAADAAPPAPPPVAPPVPAAVAAPARAPVPLVQAAAVSGRRGVSSYLLASLVGGLAGLIVFFASLYWQRANAVPPVDPAKSPAASSAPATRENGAAAQPPATTAENHSAASSAPSAQAPREAKRAEAKEPEKVTSRKEKGATAESRKERAEPARDGERAENSRAALNSALDEWIAANNSRDLNRQMAFYAPTVGAFYRSRNVSREDVRAEKERLISRANEVKMDAVQPEITVDKDGRTAVMRFRKRYVIKGNDTAVNRRGEVLQELRWQKKDGSWRITGERDLKVIQ